LGRRNCQRFLQQHFALPYHNALFDDWTDDQRSQYLIKDDQDQDQDQANLTLAHLPIIPLLRGAKDVVPQPYWPRKANQDIDDLRTPFVKRISSVAQRLADSLPSLPLKWVAKAVLQFGGAGKLTDAAMEKLAADLKKHDLIS
jgi:hypothetical protein